MADEIAVKLYREARERLEAFIAQEKYVQQQIVHWGPIVEQLAGLAGEEMPSDVQDRIKLLNAVKRSAEVEDMGLTDAIRWVFKQPMLLPLTPTGVRDRLAEMGYDLNKYAHMMPPIHNTLKRMKEAGEIREVEGVAGLGKAFEAAK